MKSYSEVRGIDPDFRIQYHWINQEQKPFQHMRSDFRYAESFGDEGIWMIWPEFEDSEGRVIEEGAPIPHNGYATMWILVREEKYLGMHRSRIKKGLKGELVVGSRVLANVVVIEKIGL